MRLKISPKTLKPSHISLLKLPERFRNDKQHATSNEHHSLPKLKNKILKSLSLVLSFPLPYALSPTLSPSPLSPLDSPFYSSFFQAAPLRYGLLWQWRVSMLRWVYVSYAVVKVAFVFFVGCWLLWLRNLNSLWWQWCIFMEYGFVFVKEKVDMCFMGGQCICEGEEGGNVWGGGGGEANYQKKLFIFGREKIIFKQSRKINIKTDVCVCLLKQQK